jgi:hypothetical protein
MRPLSFSATKQHLVEEQGRVRCDGHERADSFVGGSTRFQTGLVQIAEGTFSERNSNLDLGSCCTVVT